MPFEVCVAPWKCCCPVNSRMISSGWRCDLANRQVLISKWLKNQDLLEQSISDS